MIRLGILLSLISLLLAACASDDEPAATVTPKAGTRVLFALQGHARLDENRLVVEATHVDWFTDRPERHAGRMTNETFVQEWNSAGFDDVAPNAFLAGDVSDVVVVLAAPEATANELAFTVAEVIHGDTGTGTLGEIGLFIDSAYASVPHSLGTPLPTCEPATGATPTGPTPAPYVECQ